MRTDRQRYTDLNGLRHIYKYIFDTYAIEPRLYNDDKILFSSDGPLDLVWCMVPLFSFFLLDYQQFVPYPFEIEISLKTLWKFRLERFEQLIFSNGDRILCKGCEYDVLYTFIFYLLSVSFLNFICYLNFVI